MYQNKPKHEKLPSQENRSKMFHLACTRVVWAWLRGPGEHSWHSDYTTGWMDLSSSLGRRSSNLWTRPDLFWSPSSPYFNRHLSLLVVSSDMCWIRGRVGPRACLDTAEKKKTLLVGNRKPLPRCSVQWLSYPCCSTPAGSILKQSSTHKIYKIFLQDLETKTNQLPSDSANTWKNCRYPFGMHEPQLHNKWILDAVIHNHCFSGSCTVATVNVLCKCQTQHESPPCRKNWQPQVGVGRGQNGGGECPSPLELLVTTSRSQMRTSTPCKANRLLTTHLPLALLRFYLFA